MRHVIGSVLTTIFCFSASSAYAQDADTDAIASDRDIVVTASALAEVTKTGTPILDVPQNIQLLSGQLLEDQGISVLEDGLRNVAGVSVGGYARVYDFFRIRGFEAWQYTQLDGLPRTVSLNIEPNALERVEVIKGPASVLYGRGAPGGLVNLVSKRPQAGTFADVGLTVGSYDTVIGTADINAALAPDGSVTARLNAVYRREGSHIDYTKGVERLYLAPTIRWEFAPDGDITLLGSWSQEWNELIPAQPATGYILPNVNGKLPRSLFIGDPDNPATIDQGHITAGYEFNYALSDTLKVQQNLRASWTELDWFNIYQPLALGADQRTYTLYTSDLVEDRNTFAVDTRLAAQFDTGAVSHRLTGGFEYRREKADRIDYLGGFFPGVQFDLFDPDYSVFQRPAVDPYPSSSDSRGKGLYLQEEATFFDRLTITLAGRYDWVSIDNGISDVNYKSFVPRAGASFRITPTMSAFFSYSESFNPQAGLRDQNGNPIDPEQGVQYEGGLKLLTGDGRFNMTASVYDLTRSNVATARVTPPGTYDVSGKQRSRGFEFDAQIKPVDALQIIASYAYTDAKVLEDNILPPGNRPLNSPKHTASLWAKYTVPSGAMKGLGASIGGSHYSNQAGDTANSFFLPAYTLINANLSYDAGPVRLQLNIYNLTNKYDAVGSLLPLYVTYGTPRAVRVSASYHF